MSTTIAVCLSVIPLSRVYSVGFYNQKPCHFVILISEKRLSHGLSRL